MDKLIIYVNLIYTYEVGNDEVYYNTYAYVIDMYVDINHFGMRRCRAN